MIWICFPKPQYTSIQYTVFDKSCNQKWIKFRYFSFRKHIFCPGLSANLRGWPVYATNIFVVVFHIEGQQHQFEKLGVWTVGFIDSARPLELMDQRETRSKEICFLRKPHPIISVYVYESSVPCAGPWVTCSTGSHI